MEIGLTQSTIKRAKLSEIESANETDYKYIWEVNYADICGKKLLIIVHADTRYSMIFSDLKPSVWKNLKEFVLDAIGNALLREGFSIAEVRKYFELAGNANLTKTHGSKVSGGLKHLTVYLSYYEKILVSGMFQSMITDYANEDLCNIATHPEEKYFYPKEFFRQRMNELLREIYIS